MGTYVETTTDMEFMNSLARQVDDNFVDFTAQYSEDAALLLESAKEVEDAVMAVPGVQSATAQLVWEPQWGMDMMSDEARLELGFM